MTNKLTSPVPTEVLDEFLPPFTVQFKRVYDAKMNSVASVFGSDTEYPIPRGYGLIGPKHGDVISDQWHKAYYELVGDTATCEQAAAALNAEWGRMGFPLSRKERHLRGMKKW